MKDIKSITVVGSGTMGNGIAHVAALSGLNVHLYDIAEEALERARVTIEKNLDRQVKKELITTSQKAAALARITTGQALAEALQGAALVIEAATEDTVIKTRLFQQLDELSAPEVILATNTSSISITSLAAVTRRPAQVIGMHFMNPVPVMKLVEVIKGYITSEAVVQTVVNLSELMGKLPYVVQDYPGFIANRILMPMINEAIYALHEGVADVTAIDQIMHLGMAHPMGPLRLADFIGLDVCLAILQVLQKGFGQPKYAPCPLLVNMVQAHKLGVKSGEGFYNYRHNSKAPTVATAFT